MGHRARFDRHEQPHSHFHPAVQTTSKRVWVRGSWIGFPVLCYIPTSPITRCFCFLLATVNPFMDVPRIVGSVTPSAGQTDNLLHATTHQPAIQPHARISCCSGILHTHCTYDDPRHTDKTRLRDTQNSGRRAARFSTLPGS